MRIAVYTHVSTGSRTGENQLRELQAVAEHSGWQVVARFTDEGISAKAQGKKLGRPRRDTAKRLNAIRELRKQGVGITKIASKLGVGVSVVQRIVAEQRRA